MEVLTGMKSNATYYVDEENFVFLKNRERGRKVYVHCAVKTCIVRAMWERDGILTVYDRHDHPPQRELIEQCRFLRRLRDRASTELIPLREIYVQEEVFHRDAALILGGFSRVYKLMKLARRRTRGKLSFLDVKALMDASRLQRRSKLSNSVEDEAQPNTTQRKSAAHDDVPKKRRKIGKTLAQTAVASTSRLQDPLAMEDGLEQNRIMDEENAFEDDIQHSDNSISLSRIDFVDVKREDIDVIDIKEEPIRFDESTDIDLPAYISQGELHIKEEKKDQCEQFGEFVSVSLEQLPEDQATLAQNDIENVLMKFKMLAANTLTH